ncbi:MAG: VacB/RNase II family 3'-5' exoribonuclease [Gluconacetobacter diazotrophicus]|nr:VacB/RNase II family 3'-5' exoribonuclease [Gluconacetobacter diazotrophicus]
MPDRPPPGAPVPFPDRAPNPPSDDPAGPDAAGPVAGGLPSRETIRRFVSDATGRVGKREISRAFGLGPEHRTRLRDLLKQMEREGELAPAGMRRFRETGRLPEVLVLEVSGIDRDGDPIARPVERHVVGDGTGPQPVVFMHPELRGRPALAPGQRVLARIKPLVGRKGGGNRYEGRTLKRLDARPGRILGVFRATPPPPPDPGEDAPAFRRGQRPEAGRIVPAEKRAKAEWTVPAGEDAGADTDEIVLAEPLPRMERSELHGLRPARVVERLGRMGKARSVSLLSIHAHGIPHEFPAEALAEAEAAELPTLAGREDLRALPLVTIDGDDARDFDDAVFAEPDPDQPGGWRIVVAIADVAHYVASGSALDREARTRGNSVYFPDRVVPMLPEALSNGLCSLKPGEPRSCLFAVIRIGADGAIVAHRFNRGLMRSAARLTYEGVQAARDGTAPLPDGLAADTLDHLYGAFAALLDARRRRGTLDLDLPERRVILENDRVRAVVPRARLDSHRLIEEFMVCANVCAARELERLRRPCMFRVHAPPAPEKLDALRATLDTLGIPLKPAGEIRPADLDAVLSRVSVTPDAPLVNECVLRAQSQAEYSPDNIGHFGLGLAEYAHFTSPIRRYADLLVHRGLLAGLGLAPDDRHPDAAGGFADLGADITATERRAAAAERDALDRYIAAHLADKIGATFPGRISGVTRFGLFVTLDDTGAGGLVPVSAILADEFWMHDETAQALVGRRSGIRFRLAEPVSVRLVEAAPVTGGLLFAIDAVPAGTGRAQPG